MQIDFAGKNVVVTGGSRGIGEAISRAFVEVNANVICTSTQEAKKQRSNDGIIYLPLNLSEEKSLAKFFDSVDSEFNKVDILINNAGINKINRIDEISIKDWKAIIDVNLSGPFKMIHHFSKNMISRKYGKIVNIASIFGSITKEKRAAYTSSKAGLIGLTKTCAVDLAPFNILVNSVSPGFINTELTRTILSPAGIEELVSLVPMKRLGEVEEIARLVLFLSSDLNTFITGQNITIDGGFVNI
ncbi:MAG: SDR family oxidoreductase [Flavobacteriales bacterium]|nr:SDR family oxidoreductase [Flavobacteriales bacterium]